MEATQGPITATVIPVGPPTWMYHVNTIGVAPITSLGFVTEADLSKCTFRLEPNGPEIKARTSEKGLTYMLPELNRRQVRFAIRCIEAQKGLVELLVIDDARIAHRVGPIAGPR